jgi:hypothetical protein
MKWAIKINLHDTHENVDVYVQMPEKKPSVNNIIMYRDKVVTIHHSEKTKESVGEGTESKLYFPK